MSLRMRRPLEEPAPENTAGFCVLVKAPESLAPCPVGDVKAGVG
jgi:hypothetical protein